MLLFDMIFKLHSALKSGVAPDAGFHSTTDYLEEKTSSPFNCRKITIYRGQKTLKVSVFFMPRNTRHIYPMTVCITKTCIS